MKVQKYQLKNGLTVLAYEEHQSQVVTAQLWVRTGSAHETPKMAGVSHFIEHLLFKGTEKFAVGEIAKTVESAGGELNAYTSFDQTVYYVTVPSNRSEVALDVLSEMLYKPTFDKDEIDREREVVIEEMRRGEDQPSRKLSELLFKSFYGKHPYGRPVIGFEKIIRKVTPRQIKEDFNKRYHPKNQFLMVAGDFDPKTLRAQVERHFNIKSTHKPYTKKIAKIPKMKAKIQIEKSKFKSSRIWIGFPIPPPSHKDFVTAEVLSLVLGQGESSRLVQKLRMETPLVTSIGCGLFSTKDVGIFMISFQGEEENIPKIVEAVNGELQKAFSHGFSAEEIQKANVIFSSEQVRTLETTEGQAQFFAGSEFLFHDPLAAQKQLSDLAKVDAKKIHEFCKKYLKKQNAIVVGLVEKDAKKATQAMKSILENVKVPNKIKLNLSSKKKFNLNWQQAPKEISVQKSESNLVPIYLRKQKINPSFSMRIVFGGGLIAEAKPGLGELFSRVWGSATKKFNEQEISMLTDRTASGLQCFSGRNTLGLGWDGLVPFEKQAKDVIEEILFNPLFSEQVVEREKMVLLQQITQQKDQAAAICRKNFFEKFYPESVYQRDTMNSEKSISTLVAEDLKNHLQKVFKNKNALISLTGQWNSNWKNTFSEWTERFPKGESFLVGPTRTKPSRIEKGVIYEHMEKEQTHIIFAYPTEGMKSADRDILDVINSLLSGQGGRLFLELRDQKSLAYSLGPVSFSGMDCGHFGAQIACAPDKAKISVEEMSKQFSRLCDIPVDELELKKAKQSLIGSTALGLQTNQSVCQAIAFNEIYGLSYEHALNPQAIYEAITSEDIQRVARKYFRAEPQISIAGAQNII